MRLASAVVAALIACPAAAVGARPGPDILYAPPPRAPQFENTGVWKAPPILVSGASAYRDGEFVYQDFLFDDHGAAGAADPSDPFSQSFAPKHGTLTYPTDKAYANNAADLVELRVKPLADATAFRVTLNALKDPAFTIALGSSPAPRPWPHGAGVSSPAALFLTVHGTTAELLDATTGRALSPAPTASLDRERRQIDVRVPHAAWDPQQTTVRMAAGVGLWDATTNAYAKPGPVASTTAPGGASPSGAALFNVAFRFHEPVPDVGAAPIANTIAEGSVGAAADGSWWRERRQADALAGGDISEFSADVDFAKLRRRADDDSGVPRSGNLDRIFASHYTLGEGVDYGVSCDASQAELTGAPPTPCTGPYLSQLQPYALYVPRRPPPDRGYGLVVAMHGATANYNEYLGSHFNEQFGERGTGSIVASPEARGPSGGYASYAEADVFEMWADVGRHYALNPAMTDLTGYSMGGIGTFWIGSRWPDLFARAFVIVGPNPMTSFASLRNLPVMGWYGQEDELGGPELSEPTFLGAQQAGIRYDHWVFAPSGHITLGNNDEWGPAVDFFGDHEVDPDPPHVTFVSDRRKDTKPMGTSDHAYWVSGIGARQPGAATVDVRSLGFGVRDAPVQPVAVSAGTLLRGTHGPLPYHRRTIAWGSVPRTARANLLAIKTTNASALTIDASRARVGCDAGLDVTSDGPVKITLAGCDLTATARRGTTKIRCTSRRRLTLHLPRRARSAVIRVGHRKARRTRRHAVRISLAGLPAGRVRVRIVLRLAHGRRLVQLRRYRTCARR